MNVVDQMMTSSREKAMKTRARLKTLSAGLLIACLWLAAAAPGGAAPPADPPGLTVVTSSAHCDWSWGHSRAWHEERYAQIIRSVLLIMRENPHYFWQLENENEELAPFLKKAAKEWPGLIDEFWQRVREGRIEVIVAISNPRISEVYPETFVRNLVLGKEYFRRHAPGIEQKVFNAVDVMAGSSQVPQVLAKAGYRYFMFSRPCGKKVVFWRTGLDGTRMLSVLQHYGFTGDYVKGVRLESHSGDDILPSTDLAKAVAAWDPKQKIMATSVRYLEELEKRGGPDLELKGVIDSLELPCEASLFGNRNLYTMNNQNEDRLLCVEKAQVMASAAGGSFSKTALDAAWHDLLSCVGHAILYCWKPDYEERLEKSRATRAGGERALQEALGAVVRQIRFRPERGTPLVVFNFHAWPSTGPVEFVARGDGTGLAISDQEGHDVPAQSLGDKEAGGQRVAFVAHGVPPLGYKTYYLRPAQKLTAGVAVQSGPGSVETDLYKATITPEGGLEITDKARKTALGSPDHGSLGDVVFYDAPKPGDWVLNGPLGPRHVWKALPAGFRCIQGPAYASLVAKGTIGPHALVREVRFWRGCRRIDYLVEVDAAEGCGVFCLRFPTGLAGRVSAGIPFGAEPRENLASEPFRGEYFCLGYPDSYYATRWTDVSTADGGYTFACPPGMHAGYMFHPSDRSLEFMLLRVRPMLTGGWGQVHPSIQGTGHHEWRCALSPHPGTWRDAASYRDAMELHVPLMALAHHPGEGQSNPGAGQPTPGPRLGKTASMVEVSPASVALSSIRLVEPRPGSQTPPWEVRVYETTGRAADVVIRIGRPVERVHETNLLGEESGELGSIGVAGDTIRFRLPPWKIATLRLDVAAPR
jgi:alpha-mannosidase